MVTLSLLYNPVLAPTTPTLSVVSASLPPSLLLRCLIGLSFSVPPSPSICIFSLHRGPSPLFRFISHQIFSFSFFFSCLSVSPLFFPLSWRNNPSPSPLISSSPRPSFLPFPGFVCDHNFGVFCGTVCVCVCLLCAYTAAEERETTWQYPQCMYPVFPVSTLSLSFFLSRTLGTALFFLICRVSTLWPTMAGASPNFTDTAFHVFRHDQVGCQPSFQTDPSILSYFLNIAKLELD